MTIASIQSDLMVFTVFLLIGFVIRELLPPLQKCFLPASIIGGVVALLVGPQVWGFVSIPESFPQFAGTLIDLIMTALLFGVVVSIDKIKQFTTYTLCYFAIYGVQASLGLAIAFFCGLVWPGMPVGWGLMGQYSFNGGHGAAGTVGRVFNDLGVQGNYDIGMLFATIGLISAMVVGMAAVNYGLRKGWASFVKEPQKQPNWFYSGVLPEDKRKPIGMSTVSGNGINALAFQFSILLFALWIGQVAIRDNIAKVYPAIKTVPSMMWGVLGAAILWPILRVTKLSKYVDVPTIKTISGFLLEIVILTATSTLSLTLLQTYLVPLMIYSVIIVAVTLWMLLYLCKRFFKDQWFENCMMLYGRGTGVAANGLALVRAMDPDSRSDVAVADGVANVVYIPFTALIAVWPAMLVGGQYWTVTGLLALFLIISVTLLFLFEKKS